MTQRHTLTYACPSPIRKTNPELVLNSAETNFVRLIYDAFFSSRGPAGELRLGTGHAEFELTQFEERRYADNIPYGLDGWFVGLRAAIRKVSKGGQAWCNGQSIWVTGIETSTLHDALGSAAAVPFRPSNNANYFLDTHPATSGMYYVTSASGDTVELAANPAHPVNPAIKTIRIVHLTNPHELREKFALGEIDIMVVGGDERDLIEGASVQLGGIIDAGPSTTVSMLSARPYGALANEKLRLQLASSLPREEFCRVYLGQNGRPAYGFSSNVRLERTAVPSRRVSRVSQKTITFIVPPSERTVLRAEWLARRVSEISGITLQVQIPSWPDYWEAVRDPQAGDLLWAGIQADNDVVRDWVQYGLFDWVPLPDYYAPLKAALWIPGCPEGDMESAERDLIRQGWVMPLYHHYQCYMIRRGLSGFAIDPSDWPLPSTRHIARLSWDLSIVDAPGAAVTRCRSAAS